ncbi:putative sporulation protein YtxC [Peribacillus frigoritolerans]|uniref:putative sporulation protein YtxC n=1 Tax=Peribacillus frigoritolerans TaxID=450367 RepID=UPI00105A283C|nr:putative sporulation protein YtxC [Peribacillus frigoritolerans]TDL82048.1 putative sporulation protein YtxC [Peribacillus frigoritolerans]
MIEIFFNSPHEAETVHNMLDHERDKWKAEIVRIKEHGIQIMSNDPVEMINVLLIPVIVRYILKYKESHLMLSIIKDRFYFQEPEEQQQIIHIAEAIIEGERSEIPKVDQLPLRETPIYEALADFIRPNLSFALPSFIKFRLHRYVERLNKYIEIAIEEYKLEQEYQTFIQSLRDYAMSRETKVNVLHIVHEKELTVYNEQFAKLSQDELMKYIDRSFIHQHPMYIDASLLAPLVSIAPNKIHLYTDSPDLGMVRTIQNIFLERVNIYPRKMAGI